MTAVHVGKRCLYYFLVMMILNYSSKTNFFDGEKSGSRSTISFTFIVKLFGHSLKNMIVLEPGTAGSKGN